MRSTKKLKPLWFLMLLCLIPVWAFAQNVTVSGKVKDSTGEPVIGASVLEKGTTNGIITDFDGNFNLSVGNNSALVVSFVGYKTQEIPVNGQTSFNIVLKEDTEVLEEVVVIGYGTARKSDVTGSIASVGVMSCVKFLLLILLMLCRTGLPVWICHRHLLNQVLQCRSVFVVLVL